MCHSHKGQAATNKPMWRSISAAFAEPRRIIDGAHPQVTVFLPLLHTKPRSGVAPLSMFSPNRARIDDVPLRPVRADFDAENLLRRAYELGLWFVPFINDDDELIIVVLLMQRV